MNEDGSPGAKQNPSPGAAARHAKGASMSEQQLPRRTWLRHGLGLALASGLARSHAANVDTKKHGVVLLMRHAVTDPGTGDPPDFRLGDCATQRNLSEAGRAQAQRLGVRLREAGLAPQRVRSSAWCRCVDTARLAFGAHEVWPALNSTFQGQGNPTAQTAELSAALAAMAPGRIEAWVTHQVNISALTGEFTAMGEVLVLRGGAGAVTVLKRLPA
jgi:phosphohistidine phosphatase SixA